MADLFTSFSPSSSIFIQGASRGLGLAFTEAALEDSQVDTVLATSRHPQRSDELSRLKSQHGDRLMVRAMDVADESSIEAVAEDFGATQKSLQLIINVAGVLHDEERQMMPEKKLEELDPEDAVYSFRVNALGPLLVARHFLPYLNSDRAVIANISARVGSIGANEIGGWYSYRASKAAQNMFTRTLAIELGRYRKSHQAICVALYPGTVKTSLSAPFRSHVKEQDQFTPERAARQLMEIIDGLDKDDQGRFIAWDGETIEW